MRNLIAFNVAFYSFLSGFLACLVSICVKFAFNTDLIISSLESNNNNNNNRENLTQSSSSSSSIDRLFSLKLVLQVTFIGFSLMLNSFMWLFYSKSLHLSTNTLYSTALNKFSNFVCSALFGYLLFSERINLIRWLVGLCLLLVGILILNEQEREKEGASARESNVQSQSKISARKQEWTRDFNGRAVRQVEESDEQRESVRLQFHQRLQLHFQVQKFKSIA